MTHILKATLLFCLLLGMPSCLFAQSGIYLRGEVNNWNANADWEFKEEGGGVYTLSDKTLSGNFKIADAKWTSACNYGSNGTSIFMNTTYNLTGGSNPANISCGSYTFHCKRIILTVVSAEAATLVLESDNNGSNLKQVYVIGDNNNWNYNDDSGELKLINAEDSVFYGQVTLPAVNNQEYAQWNIYQQLGMGGTWGLSSDATSPATTGQLTKNLTGKSAVAPGTYKITFSTKTGNYTMEQVPSVATQMVVQPEKVTLVPELPDNVSILSLNNSLIYFARQDTIFNNIAKAMGKSAHWTTHSNIGKSLHFQWTEGDDTGNNEEGHPSAKTMIQTGAWTHIILQEQTERPRKNFELFKESVTNWVNFIREKCQNPNAVIIVPVNWALRNDFASYPELNKVLEDNYRKVAQELGIVLAPVGEAYELCYEREGTAELATWFRPNSENNGMTDDRHPSKKSTYMTACIEYGVIFGEDPNTIAYVPDGLDAEEAAKMRQYAHDALMSFTQVVDHHKGTVQFVNKLYDQFGMEMHPQTESIWNTNGGNINANGLFTSPRNIGEYTVNTQNGSFTSTATVTVAKAKTMVDELPAITLDANQNGFTETFDMRPDVPINKLPEGWRIDRQIGSPRTIGLFALASDTTMYVQSEANITLPANAKNGTWSFGNGNDRAIGGISTGVSNATRCVNVYAHIKNEVGAAIDNITLSYDVEKYREGKNPAGFDVQLYYSLDGMKWVSAGPNFNTHFDADKSTKGYSEIPGVTVNVSQSLPLSIATDADVYLAWNISVTTGTTCNAAQALAIDNVKLASSSTGIDVVRTHQEKRLNDGAVYSILGQKLSNSDIRSLTESGYHGIVIINGRKVMIK
ncbi:MAG: hypothetical protein ACOYJK_08375 [Prevotella sp.]